MPLRGLRSFALPVAPADEAKHISDVVNQTLDVAGRMLEAAEAKFRSIKSLNQSILAKAFRGELVPQDPSDEPASVLLERIRAERAQAESEKKAAKKRGRKKA